jgi:hypothetical protein
MATQVIRILTTGISHDGLSDATQKILSIVSERFAAEQPQIGTLVLTVQNNYTGLQQAMSHSACSSFTPAIKTGHGHRVNSLVAFKLLLGNKLRQSMNPEIVAVAQTVKTVLVNGGLWNYTSLSYQHISALIANVIQELSAPQYRELLVTLGIADAFDALIAQQRQYVVFETQRIEEQAGDTTPRLYVARERLLQCLNTLVSFIIVSAQNDPAVYGAAAQEIDEVVRSANAVTRSGQTRKANAAEAKQAEAHNGGQAQNAAHPLQGSPATSVTPDTNPVGPPAKKGDSTA